MNALRKECILCLLCAVTVLPGCQRSVEPVVVPVESNSTELQFVDITAGTGFVAPFDNGRDQNQYTILESLGGGSAAWDFDCDGHCDIFATGGGGFTEDRQIFGRNSTLHRRRPGLHRQELRWSEVADVAGCQRSRFYSHGCAVADIDNDGFPDLLVTGYGGLQLFRNLGDGTFEEAAAESGLTDAQWSSSAGWGDVNGDGFTDLYVAHYADWSFDNHPVCPGPGPDGRDICPPREFSALTDVLYLNQGDGRFVDAADRCGLVSGGKGLGVVLADVDDDQDLDIYVANDTTPNFLYLNDGRGNFTECGLASGTALDDRGVPNGSMGTAVADFDQDGRVDLWVTNFEMETFGLYRNLGSGQFQHLSRDSGVNAIGSRFVGFGTVAEDFDLDGDVDIAVSNGHVVYYPPGNREAQTPVYLDNVGSGQFRRLVPGPENGYFRSESVGRGLLATDIDDDGRPDLIVTHLRSPAKILRNSGRKPGTSLRILLSGTNVCRDATGAKVEFSTETMHSVRHLYGGGSYLCARDRGLEWGLMNTSRVVTVSVTWPSGTIQEFSVKGNVQSTYVVREGASDVVRLPF